MTGIPGQYSRGAPTVPSMVMVQDTYKDATSGTDGLPQTPLTALPDIQIHGRGNRPRLEYTARTGPALPRYPQLDALRRFRTAVFLSYFCPPFSLPLLFVSSFTLATFPFFSASLLYPPIKSNKLSSSPSRANVSCPSSAYHNESQLATFRHSQHKIGCTYCFSIAHALRIITPTESFPESLQSPRFVFFDIHKFLI